MMIRRILVPVLFMNILPCIFSCPDILFLIIRYRQFCELCYNYTA